ncbi:MAG: hypothetical protein K1X31_06730, partial [Gemmatimonadaceae bacterium]|nr:hypothetical protein [Gemmatimonadaceae bacterium]
MKERRAIRLLPTRRGDPRASVAAFVLQLVLLLIVVPSLVVPVAIEFLRDDAGREVTPERISFITAAPRGGPPTIAAPRAGGDGREAAQGPVAPEVPL